MRSKFFVTLVCCLLALALLVPSILLGAQLSLPNLGKLLEPPKILSFSSIGELKLLLQQQEEGQKQAYPETHIYTYGVSAANADTITKRVWAVSLNDGLDPRDISNVGFKTITLRNTGKFSQSGVTVTVTANILKQQQPAGSAEKNLWNISLFVRIFKDGNPLDDVYCYQRVTQSGSQSVTSPPFTMEPNHDYYAAGYIYCESYVEAETASVIAEITDIGWKF